MPPDQPRHSLRHPQGLLLFGLYGAQVWAVVAFAQLLGWQTRGRGRVCATAEDSCMQCGTLCTVGRYTRQDLGV